MNERIDLPFEELVVEGSEASTELVILSGYRPTIVEIVHLISRNTGFDLISRNTGDDLITRNP